MSTLSFDACFDELAKIAAGIDLSSRMMRLLRDVVHGRQMHPTDRAWYADQRARLGLPFKPTEHEATVARLVETRETAFPPYGDKVRARLDEVLNDSDPGRRIQLAEAEHDSMAKGPQHALYRFEQRLRGPHGLADAGEVDQAVRDPGGAARKNWSRIAGRLEAALKSSPDARRRAMTLPTQGKATDRGAWSVPFQAVQDPETGKQVPLIGVLARKGEGNFTPLTTRTPDMGGGGRTEGNFSDLLRVLEGRGR